MTERKTTKNAKSTARSSAKKMTTRPTAKKGTPKKEAAMKRTVKSSVAKKRAGAPVEITGQAVGAVAPRFFLASPRRSPHLSLKHRETASATHVPDVKHDHSLRPNIEHTLQSDEPRLFSDELINASREELQFKAVVPVHDPRGRWPEYPDSRAIMTDYARAAHTKPAKRARHMRRVYAIRGVLALTVVVIPLSIYGYLHSNAYKNFSERNELQSILAQVASAVVVPAGATPQVFKVTDPKKLAEQGGAFSRLQVGDRVIYYKETGTVVLYSEEKKKVAAVSQVDDSNSIGSGVIK